MPKLTRSFYRNPDTPQIARLLLGKYLCTRIDGILTAGKIVETEAYQAPADKASHAYGNRRTARTEVMFWDGGTAYVYLCYGIHHLFNVVTGKKEQAHAVLIRGLEPTDGIDEMLLRRNMSKLQSRISAGPGTLSQALGIHKSMTGLDLTASNSPIWLEDRGRKVSAEDIIASPRVGIDYAEEWIEKPWRFRIKGNKYCSPAK